MSKENDTLEAADPNITLTAVSGKERKAKREQFCRLLYISTKGSLLAEQEAMDGDEHLMLPPPSHDSQEKLRQCLLRR